jgi:hypothetical protein
MRQWLAEAHAAADTAGRLMALLRADTAMPETFVSMRQLRG